MMKKKAKKLGVMYSPNVIFGVGKQDGKWVGSFDIGDYYYETDPYTKKEHAISELCGCLEALKLKTEKIINELNEQKSKTLI
jgi:hypothetical protein